MYLKETQLAAVINAAKITTKPNASLDRKFICLFFWRFALPRAAPSAYLFRAS
jgi:hypothetical protein